MEERPSVQDKSLIIAREEKNMKEAYENPMMEIVEIDGADVIFASTIDCSAGGGAECT